MPFPIVLLCVCAAAFALLGLLLSGISQSLANVATTIGEVLAGVLMSRAAAWMAPRHKLLTGLSSVLVLIAIAPIMWLYARVPMTPQAIEQFAISDVPGVVGVVLGARRVA